MLKKTIAILLALCMVFSIYAFAESVDTSTSTYSSSSQRPTRGDFDPAEMPEGFDPSNMPRRGMQPPSGVDNTTDNAPQGQVPFGNGNFPDGMYNAQPTQQGGVWGFVKTYSTPITSVVLLGLAYVFVSPQTDASLNTQ